MPLCKADNQRLEETLKWKSLYLKHKLHNTRGLQWLHIQYIWQHVILKYLQSTISMCKPDWGLQVLTIMIQWHVYKSISQQQASEFPPVETKLRVCIFKTSQDKFYPLTNAPPQSTESRNETQPFSSAQMDADPEVCWFNRALIHNSRWSRRRRRGGRGLEKKKNQETQDQVDRRNLINQGKTITVTAEITVTENRD